MQRWDKETPATCESPALLPAPVSRPDPADAGRHPALNSSRIMEAYNEFDRLARVALARYKVNVGTFYGRRETCLSSEPCRFYVSVKGQGLPIAGVTAGREKPAEAITEVVSRLKQIRRDADLAAAAAHAAAYAATQQSSTLNDTAPCQPGN